jgi:hypothetical protein
MPPRYIFIVGLPRTGTKLMVNILQGCQETPVYITPENFYLGRFLKAGAIKRIKKIGDFNNDLNVIKLVNRMYSKKFWGEYWIKLADGRLGVQKEKLLEKILNSDRSLKTIYSILLEIHVKNKSNVILGDKTGPHLYRIETLMTWFPESKIVHTYRDPRAVFASEHKKRFHARSRRANKIWKEGKILKYFFSKITNPLAAVVILLYITVASNFAVFLYKKYRKKYPNNYYLSRYEDLVLEPEGSIRKLCKFLSIQYDNKMIAPPKIDSSFSKNTGQGFNANALYNWKNYVKPSIKLWFEIFCKIPLKEFNYAKLYNFKNRDLG